MEDFEEFKQPYEESKHSSTIRRDHLFNKMSPIQSFKRDFIEHNDPYMNEDFDRLTIDNPSQIQSIKQEKI